MANILGALQRGAQTGGMIQQIEAGQAATQRANALRQLAAGGFPQDRAGQQQMVNRAAAIDPQAAIDWNKHFQGMQKAQVEAEKAAAPSYIANLQGVDSADGFAAAKARLAAEGHDVEDWPEYSPQAVNMVLQKSRILAGMKPGEGSKVIGRDQTLVGPGGEIIAQGPQNQGPFAGTSQWAQQTNTLLAGDPSSPEYAAAYNAMASPKQYFDEALGQIVRVSPDMSAFTPPGGAAGAQQTVADQAPQGQIAAPAALPGAPAGLQQPVVPGVSVQQVTQPKPTEAEKAVDREFGKAHADFVLHGGYADGEKNLNQINRVIGRLESGSDKLTGPLIGSVPDAALARLFPDAADTAEQVAEVTQRNLRLVLGGQFSEREGENLIKRAYNIALPEEINARRMTNLYRAMKQAQDAKFAAGRYFDQHRTMRGYQGTAAAEAQAEFLRATEDLDAIPGVTDDAEVPAAQQGAEEGQTAVNPQTGERIILQNGQWIPVQ